MLRRLVWWICLSACTLAQDGYWESPYSPPPMVGSRPAAPNFAPGIAESNLQSRPWRSINTNVADTADSKDLSAIFKSERHARRVRHAGEQLLVQLPGQQREDYSVVPGSAVTEESVTLPPATQLLRGHTENYVVRTDPVAPAPVPQHYAPDVAPPRQGYPQAPPPAMYNSYPQAPSAAMYNLHTLGLIHAAQLNAQATMLASSQGLANSIPMALAYSAVAKQNPLPNSLGPSNYNGNPGYGYPYNAQPRPMMPPPHSGFPLLHPFGGPPQPDSINFGAMPEYPRRIQNAMEFEGRSAVF
eukprot:c39216_g1_i1.p1 GENE.c39216_g1_i1~~c39216_g1_i1.p1  ORF type:complete len:300 (-),score=24.78 c39216_g1_i1:29-928(-)